MDKREGKGTLSWADGRMYEGDWSNGIQHGAGKFKDKAG